MSPPFEFRFPKTVSVLLDWTGKQEEFIAAAGKLMRLSQLPGVFILTVMSGGAVIVIATGVVTNGALEPSRAVNPDEQSNRIPRTTPWEI